MRNSGSQRIDSQRLMQSSSTQYQRPASLNRLEHPSATRIVLQISTDLINGQRLLYQENPPTRSINHLPPLSITKTSRKYDKTTNSVNTECLHTPPFRACQDKTPNQEKHHLSPPPPPPPLPGHLPNQNTTNTIAEANKQHLNTPKTQKPRADHHHHSGTTPTPTTTTSPHQNNYNTKTTSPSERHRSRSTTAKTVEPPKNHPRTRKRL
ncbi:hypothetical protein QL285_032240 [Trifolium repens]|nr:hypothetical protein QL285_032240 [Trifolium repens]